MKDLEDRTNQLIEPSNNEVKIISERTQDLIQTPTEMVQSDRFESCHAQIERQSSSFHSDVDVEKPATPATQTEAAINQEFVVSQENAYLTATLV
jgi:hypothetical protein